MQAEADRCLYLRGRLLRPYVNAVCRAQERRKQQQIKRKAPSGALCPGPAPRGNFCNGRIIYARLLTKPHKISKAERTLRSAFLLFEC